MTRSWIPIEKIQPLIEHEHFIVAWFTLLATFLFYRLFLKKISERRHQTIRWRFKNALAHLVFSSVLAFCYWQTTTLFADDDILFSVSRYLGLLALFTGAVVLIKLGQLVVYSYLFFSNISSGVPKLITNIFSLMFAIFLTAGIAASVFGFRLETVLATSAFFSVVLGLALQDTLGNLFAGVAVQIDHPYKLGDWIEVQNASSKWVGQVQEITWRGTFLSSFLNETILIPNKTIAQSQLVILAPGNTGPLRQGHSLRFAFDENIDRVKHILFETVSRLTQKDGLLPDPPPRVLLTEIGDSYQSISVYYSIDDYGKRYRVSDLVLSAICAALRENSIHYAIPSFKLDAP